MAMQSYDHKIHPTKEMDIFELAARAISARNTYGCYEQDNHIHSWAHMNRVDCHYGYAAHSRLCGMRLDSYIEASNDGRDERVPYPNYITIYDGWRTK